MAEKPSTTRRALLSASRALPVIIATPLAAKEIGGGEAWRLKKRAFIEEMDKLAPKGRYVATKAMAMDLDPDSLRFIQTYHRDNDHLMPALHFAKRGAPHVTVVVDAVKAYEYGPVL